MSDRVPVCAPRRNPAPPEASIIPDVAALREEADRFAPLTDPVDPERLTEFQARLTTLDRGSRIGEVVAALDAGRPDATATLVDEIAGELGDADSAGAPRQLIYWTAVAARLGAQDLEQLMETIEGRLNVPRAPDPELWDQTTQGQALSEAVAGRLVPVAGLDVEATLEYTRIYADNFPPFSRPLGDVDWRATAWIAQILDLGSIRRTHREIMGRLAPVWKSRYPKAADQLRRWTAGPPPANPIQDQPWVRALVTLARTQV